MTTMTTVPNFVGMTASQIEAAAKTARVSPIGLMAYVPDGGGYNASITSPITCSSHHPAAGATVQEGTPIAFKFTNRG